MRFLEQLLIFLSSVYLRKSVRWHKSYAGLRRKYEEVPAFPVHSCSSFVSREQKIESQWCVWKTGTSYNTYVKIPRTICDYVIWWELRMSLTTSNSSVGFWVGCYMFAQTMGTCTHAFTSQNGINAFGVERLGVEVCGISTFNSTQCL